MKLFNPKPIAAVAALTMAAILSPGAVHAEFPEKPVTLMVGYPPGGGTDTYARALVSFIGDPLGKPMVVVNKPGASGMIAAMAVKKAKPDGYTIYIISTSSFVSREIIDGEKAKLEALKDFEPLGVVGQLVGSLLVPEESPYKSAKDLVDAAKANPGKLRWASQGKATGGTIVGAHFLSANGITATAVPFKGGSKARAAVASKQVDFGFGGVQLLAGFKGKLRALGVAAEERDAVFSEIPTFQEQGLAMIDHASPMVVWAPKGVPADAKKKLIAAVETAATTDGYKAALKKVGAVGMYQPPETAEKRVIAMKKTLTPIIASIMKKK